MKRRTPSTKAHGTNIESLLLRLTLGPMIVTHGYNKVFGRGGLEGTTKWFDSLGFDQAHIHARLAAATEIGAGTAFTLGAASPLPAAAIMGLMSTAAVTDHKGKGFFIFKGGWEYVAVVGATAFVSAILGPGRVSIDGIRGRQRRGLGWAVAAAALGVASSAALLKTSYHPEPEAEDSDT